VINISQFNSHCLIAAICIFLCSPLPCRAKVDKVIIGSKKFTESVILGEIAAQLIGSNGAQAVHKAELGGTQILFKALELGEVDIYPEYTGTIRHEILATLQLKSDEEIDDALNQLGISITSTLGFNNTYAIGLRQITAQRLKITTISELINHPDLRLGFSNEFLHRGDGWEALKRVYALPQQNVRGMDHDLAYRALQADDLDVMEFYSTDAEISYYNLFALRDDRGHFPVYNAVYLYRSELSDSHPEIVEALKMLEGNISVDLIRELNSAVKIEGKSHTIVAAEFLREKFGITTSVVASPLGSRLMKATFEHLMMVVIGLFAGIIVAIPLGIVSAKKPGLGYFIIGFTGIIQTVPALALLVFMIPIFGIYAPPAIAALFLYSLLPIVRNTHAGLITISSEIQESADALGLRPYNKLLLIELPLASTTILAGIKTAGVVTVGFATLGALIGAGGYGQSILTGIRLDNYALILEGAIPAAVMALAVQFVFDLIERAVVPKGLRLKR